MTTETSGARNWTDVATTADEICWGQSIFIFSAQVADAAKAGEIDHAQMIEMIADAIATAAWRFKPRAELLDQVCADVRFALESANEGCIN